MKRKHVIILAIVALIVVIEIAVVVVLEVRKGVSEIPNGAITNGESVVGEDINGGVSDFTTEVPKDAVETKPKIDVPIESDPEGQQRLGVYPVTVTKDGYFPSMIVVIQGDIVNLELTSQGGTYDIYSPAFGFYLSAPDGETTQISFGAPVVGTFRVECRDYCPKGEKIYGQLIVKPRE